MEEKIYEIDGRKITYNVTDDGYDIYLDGVIWITQHGDCGKPMNGSLSYEENCILQIEDIVKSNEAAKNPQDPMADVKAQIEYLAMMSDVDLAGITGGEE